MFAFDDDDDAEVNEAEFNFLHYKSDGLWDYPRKVDRDVIKSINVFFGPSTPSYTGKDGYRFSDDCTTMEMYKYIKMKRT